MTEIIRDAYLRLGHEAEGAADELYQLLFANPDIDWSSVRLERTDANHVRITGSTHRQ